MEYRRSLEFPCKSTHEFVCRIMYEIAYSKSGSAYRQVTATSTRARYPVPDTRDLDKSGHFTWLKGHTCQNNLENMNLEGFF